MHYRGPAYEKRHITAFFLTKATQVWGQRVTIGEGGGHQERWWRQGEGQAPFIRHSCIDRQWELAENLRL